MVVDEIRKAIVLVVKNLDLPEIDFSVTHPADEKNGNYSTNIAMVAAKQQEENPRELAEKIKEELEKDGELKKFVDRIEVAGPGFINFWLKDSFLIERLGEMRALGEKCGESDFMKGKRVLVEYSSPNIAKRFSVGHLRSTIIGQSLFNLYKFSGAKVTNDNHLGDWGTQFGMIIAAVEERPDFDWEEADVNLLEQLYVDFNKKIDEDPALKDKARDAFARLENGDPAARTIWQRAWDISMAEFKKIYQRLGIPEFEHQYGESIYEKMMPSIINLAKKKKVARESQGALIVEFPDLPPAILLKSNGTTTYFTRDLATIKKRLTDENLKSDLYVYEVGAEQTLHFRQVFAAAKMLWPEETKDIEFVHVAHGLMTLPEGKMSTRKGRTVKLEDLLNRAEEAATDKRIGIGAVKYNELERAPGMNYVFKWDEALSMEGNSGPYLQYVYVRCKGILEKVGRKTGTTGELNEDERKLLSALVKFGDGEVVEMAANNFAPQLICAYLFDLAQKFNGFYDRNRVAGSEKEGFRLLLTSATAQVIKNGLELLGIEVVEKM